MSDLVERFGFAVERHPLMPVDWSNGQARATSDELGWSVHLPHQCEVWDIAGDQHNGVTRVEAVAALEAFISEAQEALRRLKAGEALEGPCLC